MPRYNHHKHTCSFQLYLSLSDDSDAGWRQAGQIADLNSHADLVMLHAPTYPHPIRPQAPHVQVLCVRVALKPHQVVQLPLSVALMAPPPRVFVTV